jgi:lysophospholipase L1-like esterase
VISLSGAKINDIDKYIQSQLNATPNTKTIMIHVGTNNIPVNSEDQIMSKLSELILNVKCQFPNINIIFSSILPRPQNNECYGTKIQNINKKLKSLCLEHNIYFAASYKPFVKYGKVCSQYYYDGVHLTQQGTFRLRQFMSQRLAEYGNKPLDLEGHSTYLIRPEWESLV